MHTTRVACSEQGEPLPAPHSYCSCEVGSFGCAHLISIHFAAVHVQNCVRIWKLVNPDENPLTPKELLALFPPCIMGAQRLPCRAQFLAKRARLGKRRADSNRLRIIDEVDGEMDESDDDQDDEDVKVIPLMDLISTWTCKMMKLSPTSLEGGNAQADRPRVVSSASEDVKAMKQDFKKYLSKFPLDEHGLYEQDFLHEMEYRSMYLGEIPKNNNWGFYLYKTAVDRQTRIREYNTKYGGNMTKKYVCSPIQMRVKTRIKRSRPGSTKRNSINRSIKHESSKKIIKLMNTKLEPGFLIKF